MAGPDVVILIPPLLLVFGDKTTQQQTDTGAPAALPKEEVEANISRTPPQGWFTHQIGKGAYEEGHPKSKREALSALLNNGITTFVEAHLLLPHTSGSLLKAGDIEHSQLTLEFDDEHDVIQTLKLDRYRLAIESSCLHSCGVFFPSVVNILLSKFPAKDKIDSWQLKAIDPLQISLHLKQAELAIELKKAQQKEKKAQQQKEKKEQQQQKKKKEQQKRKFQQFDVPNQPSNNNNNNNNNNNYNLLNTNLDSMHD